jgi:hypothetical protein
MAPATGTALLILVAFVLPGFVTLVARETTYVARDAVTPFERLLLLTLDDERLVGGYFGRRSMAAYSGDTQDIFIERRWELDEEGWFLRPTPSSLGVWVPHKHIVSVEMYRPQSPRDQTSRQMTGGNA